MKYTSLFSIYFIVSMAFGETPYKEKNAVEIPHSEVIVHQVKIPSIEAAHFISDISSYNPVEGIAIGNTDYDFAINSGSARRLATHNNGKKIHMIFPERDMFLSSPADRLTNKYVLWDEENPDVLISSYPRPKTVASSGFAALDVIPTGNDAGRAIVTYVSGATTYFAIDGQPGPGSFIESAMPAAISNKNITDPQVTAAPDGQTIWFAASVVPNDIIIARSTDFGASWTGIDSLRRFLSLPECNITTSSAPILVTESGILYRVASLKGKGALPPVGTATESDADRIGYFSSTDNGTTWSWTTMILDGERMIVGSDTVYVLGENFSQYGASVDNAGRLHMVLNGYSVKRNGEGYSNYFCVFYRRSDLPEWILLSNDNDAHIPQFDTDEYRWSGNAFGFAYPNIAAAPDGDIFFAVWSQPIVHNGSLVLKDGFVQYELKGCESHISGSRFLLTLNPSPGGVFPFIGRNLTVTAENKSVDILFLADTSAGTAVMGERTAQKVDWIFKRYVYSISGTADQPDITARSYRLEQNYPNPFNPSTTIHYNVPSDANVSIEVFDMLGRSIATVVNEFMNTGEHTATFDGSRLSSGIYYYKMTAGNFTAVKKMILMK